MLEEVANLPCLGLFTCLSKSVAASGVLFTVETTFTFLFANFVLAILNTYLIYSNKDKRFMAPFVVTILTTVTLSIGVFLNFGVYDIVAIVPLALVISILVFIIKTRKLTKFVPNNNMQVTQQVPYQENVAQPMLMPNQAVEQPVIQQPVAQVVEQQPVVQSQSQQVQTQPTTTQTVQPQATNTMIDLNNLTPEQKDQLLTVLLQNNQKTNE